MSENRPGPPDRKLGLVAPISIAVIVALIILAAVMFQERPQKASDPQPPQPAPVATAPVAIPSPTQAALGRAELLEDANLVAAAYAADGGAAPQRKDALAGRTFSIRIPFGCEGPQVRPGSAQAFYEFDPEKRTIRLVARPGDWTTLPAIQELQAADVEAVEGFWIPHPWSYAERCPKPREKPVPAAPTPAAAQSLGLAQLFETGGSRIERRGARPYEHVIRLGDDEQPPLAAGYRLVLEGRFATFPSGRVARCWSESADHRPVCLYAVQFGRIAFETEDGGRQIAEWRE